MIAITEHYGRTLELLLVLLLLIIGLTVWGAKALFASGRASAPGSRRRRFKLGLAWILVAGLVALFLGMAVS